MTTLTEREPQAPLQPEMPSLAEKQPSLRNQAAIEALASQQRLTETKQQALEIESKILDEAIACLEKQGKSFSPIEVQVKDKNGTVLSGLDDSALQALQESLRVALDKAINVTSPSDEDSIQTTAAPTEVDLLDKSQRLDLKIYWTEQKDLVEGNTTVTIEGYRNREPSSNEAQREIEEMLKNLEKSSGDFANR